MFEYIDRIKEILNEVESKEKENIVKASNMMVDAILNKQNIYIFGASHAGILTQEMFYRAGGLITINPIFGKEISLSNEPITITSNMERLQGYGKILANTRKISKDDILILHSVSGRNPVTVELGLTAKEKGAKIISITNLAYSKSTKSRDKSGKLLYEISDLVIDNHGSIGDAEIEIKDGLKVSPTSTVIGASILNTVISLIAKSLEDKSVDVLPFFYSANLDGGDELNLQILSKYEEQIDYKY